MILEGGTTLWMLYTDSDAMNVMFAYTDYR